MTNLQCSDWSILPDGTVKCLGTVTESAGLLPPITFAEANILLGAILSLYAIVFVIVVNAETIKSFFR